MSAIISKCGKYRYRLERIVGPGSKTCLFIMLNPSTADAVTNDRTIRRCMGFAEAFGCGRLVVGNLFAFRTRKPAELRRAPSPEGPYNLRHLRKMCGEADIVIAAWGVSGKHLGQDDRVRQMLQTWGVPLHYLGLTKDGHPRHPLYMKGALRPRPWKH
jgi:hypothetical protein